MRMAKNCVPKYQSEINSAHAASRIAKISRLRTAVTYQAQTVRGNRVRDMPSVRPSVTVAQKFTDERIAATENKMTPDSQSCIPAWMDRKNETEIANKEAIVRQNERPLRSGNAISLAPI